MMKVPRMFILNRQKNDINRKQDEELKNELLKRLCENKKVLILGFGREGKSTLEYCRAIVPNGVYTVADVKDVSDQLPGGVDSRCGGDYLEILDEYDVVFKSPGIVLPKAAQEYSAIITSQTEVFISEYKEQIVGITGTKGKSTTSSLLYHVLKSSGRDALLAGNIGIPVFDIAKDVKENTIIVLELSCHQLEFAHTSPHIAVLLNIYEDHLDHYKTREKYAAAKKNIFFNQGKDDFLYTTEETVSGENIKSQVSFVTKDVVPFESFEDIGASLKGTHNLLNCAFVYDICRTYGVTDKEFTEAVASFKTLPHRLEFAGKYGGVDYYDDSISTTVMSAISAVESVKNAKILLVGGMERNIEYKELVDYVSDSKLRLVICMYESGKRFFEMYNAKNAASLSAPFAVYVKDLAEAVDYVKKNARENEACLLSPAAASYGYFKNFEERGDVFKNLIKS